MIQMQFKAPNESVELAIVNFCIEKLGLEFGQFWYEWFKSRSERNQNLKIYCSVKGLRNKIREELSVYDEFPAIEKIHELTEYDFTESDFWHDDLKICYMIHFKTKEEVPFIEYENPDYV